MSDREELRLLCESEEPPHVVADTIIKAGYVKSTPGMTDLEFAAFVMADPLKSRTEWAFAALVQTLRDKSTRIAALEAEVERLKANQRTPGTVEICERCHCYPAGTCRMTGEENNPSFGCPLRPTPPRTGGGG